MAYLVGMENMDYQQEQALKAPEAAIVEETSVSLPDELIEAVQEAIDDEDQHRAYTLLDAMSPPDVANLLDKIDGADRKQLIDWFGENFTSDMFLYLSDNVIRHIFSDMNPIEVARIIADMDTDDAMELLEQLDEDFRVEVVKKLSKKLRMHVEEGFTFPEDSAGRMMSREVAVVPEFWTVGKTLDYARMARNDLPDQFFDIFIVDPGYRVVGEVPLDALVKAQRSTKVADIARREIFKIPVTMDQEEVAHLFRRDVILAAPVVDDGERLIGVITIDDIVDVIDEEAEEDVLKLGGVSETDIYSAIFSTVRSRFSWLAINLVTAILASVCISFFDEALEKVVALAILMPIVTGMGGNAGTQAMTVAVRAIATKELSGANALRVIGKECLVGNINGILFAILMGGLTMFWFHSVVLGVVIGIAMLVNLTVACFAGVSIPLFLDRVRIDPALASTVFLTTVTDIVGFVVFLSLGTMLLI